MRSVEQRLVRQSNFKGIAGITTNSSRSVICRIYPASIFRRCQTTQGSVGLQAGAAQRTAAAEYGGRGRHSLDDGQRVASIAYQARVRDSIVAKKHHERRPRHTALLKCQRGHREHTSARDCQDGSTLRVFRRLPLHYLLAPGYQPPVTRTPFAYLAEGDFRLHPFKKAPKYVSSKYSLLSGSISKFANSNVPPK